MIGEKGDILSRVTTESVDHTISIKLEIKRKNEPRTILATLVLKDLEGTASIDGKKKPPKK